MTRIELGKRLCPLDTLTEEDVESTHLKFLISPPPGKLVLFILTIHFISMQAKIDKIANVSIGWDFAESISRFNANISYSGLAHAVTQEHLFAENKEKLIFSALTAILNRDASDVEQMPVAELEQQFHAIRRLVASKAGFSAFTSLAGFREKIGKLFKLDHVAEEKYYSLPIPDFRCQSCSLT